MTRGISLGVAAAATILITGVPLPAQAADGTIMWGRDGDIDSLDPHRATSTLSRMVWYQIYDPLLEFNTKGEVIPNLAREWKIDQDGRRVTFMLQEGIKCHDGSAFTASDVKWTADRALSDAKPSLTKSSWGPINSVEVVDELTVRFNLDKPFAAFVPYMADQFASMLCESNEGNDDFGVSSAIGTGPWKFAKWIKGDRIVLESNPYYRNFGRQVENNGPPHAKQLVIRAIPEGQTRVAALRTGELDVIVPPIEQVESLQNGNGVEVHVAQNTGQNMFLEFAIARKPFNDVRARKAVAHALNMQLALDIVYGDLVQREHCPVSQGVLGNDQDFCKQRAPLYDPDKARALLDELGYNEDNPMEIILSTWHGDNREDMLQVFQNQLHQYDGAFEVRLEVMDIGTLNARVKQENNKAEGPGFIDLMGWTWFDPDVLYLLWHSPGAYEGYNDPELDRLLDETRTTMDLDERRKVVQQVFDHLLTNAVHVPVYTPGWLWLYATSEDTQGFRIGPFNRPLFNDIGA